MSHHLLYLQLEYIHRAWALPAVTPIVGYIHSPLPPPHAVIKESSEAQVESAASIQVGAEVKSCVVGRLERRNSGVELDRYYVNGRAGQELTMSL